MKAQNGTDDKIVGLYAAGPSVRDIRAHLEEVYGLKVSPDLISRVTDAVLDEVREWQRCALDWMYPIVIFDALMSMPHSYRLSPGLPGQI